MTFTVSTDMLFKPLQILNGAVGGNATLPILEDFLFDLDGNKLTITASDLETSMKAEVDVISQQNGQVALPAKILMDVLKSLPTQPLTFKISQENFTTEIISSNGKYKIAGENGSDFPTIGAMTDQQQFTLGSIALKDAIGKTVFATSTDELRPAMTGVFMEIDSSGINFVATDAHKLVKYRRIASMANNEDKKIILPKKGLGLLLKALPADETPVEVSFNNSHVSFVYNTVQLTCRLIDSRYPDYNAVIPKDNPFTLTVDRTELLNSLKRIAIFSTKSTYQVIFEISEQELSLSAQDIDYSNEAKERIPCEYNGDDMEIAFNAKFLAEILSVLDTETIHVRLDTPQKAGLILPSENGDEEEVMMLLMPIMMNP